VLKLSSQLLHCRKSSELCYSVITYLQRCANHHIISIYASLEMRLNVGQYIYSRQTFFYWQNMRYATCCNFWDNA